MSEIVTSAANPTVKRVRALADRKHRRRQQAYVVEGVQPVWRAVTAGATIETVVCAPELLRNEAAVRMVDELAAAGTQVVRITAELFDRLSDRDGPAGLLAIVSGGVAGLDTLTVTHDSVFLALHELSTPGNIGTIVRTADAAGASGVILLGATADPLSPAAVKASMGSLFSVALAAVPTEPELLSWARGAGLHVCALTGAGSTDLWQAELPRPLLLLLGNEGAGLTESLVTAAASRVRIPMEGTAESLNVAAAAAVVLYELKRRAG
ncbi:MAG TPA: RNA methyltransferase [Jatrophihabitans sp.]|nr:RNA methyltransferase [Jatrophihabitans sp.]